MEENLRNYLIYLTIITYIGTIYIKWLWSRRKFYALSRKFPGPFSMPFIGSILPTLKFVKYQVGGLLIECQKYTGLFVTWLGPTFVLVVIEPEDLEVVFSKQVTEKPSKEYSAIRDFFTKGIFSMTGTEPEYKTHRKIIMPSFSAGKLKRYHEIILNNIDVLVNTMNQISNKGTVDIGMTMLRYSGDVIGESFFGVNLNFRQGNLDEDLLSIEACFKGGMEKVAKIWHYIRPLYKMSPLYRRQLDANKKSRILARRILDEKKKTFKINSDYDNVTDMLLDGIEKGHMTYDDAVGHIINLWMAASDTSGNALQFFITMLAIHKECQDKVYEEIKKFFENREDTYINSEDLREFPYLKMCMEETQRLFPPGPVNLRYSPNEVEFKKKNFVAPPGTVYLISSFVSQRNPKIWSNPSSFIPERFTEEECKKRHPLAFFPFSSGYRGCKGFLLAKDFVLTSMIYLLKHFEFRSDKKMEDLKFEFDIDCRIAGGYMVEIIPRN